MIHGARGL
jgi:hypothetical protein